MLTYRRIKKRLQASKRTIRIKSRYYTAEFDRDFCAGAKPRDFIERIDGLTGTGRILKTGDASYVSNITWNGKNIVVKRYDNKGFFHSLRHTIKKARARRAWLYAHFLEALDIDTPRALAYIEQRRGLLVWRSYLVTQYIEGKNLWLFLRDDGVPEQRKMDVIQQVVNLLDKLWKSRITHGDLKHTNVLITQNGPVLTDLDGMIVHRCELLYGKKRAKDVERFIRKTNISPALSDYCEMLISKTQDSRKKLLGGFEKLRIDNWTIHVRNNFPKEHIEYLISQSNSFGEDRDHFTRVRSSGHTRVFKYSVTLDGAARSLYLKKYLHRSALDFAKHLFRPSRARRAFNATLMLQKNGFDAPALTGLFEKHAGPLCTGNLLLTEEVVNSRAMPQLLTDLYQNPGKGAFVRRRSLITAFGETIGQMHAKGIFHGDLRLGNVLVVREDQKWRFFFIDNERTKKFRRSPDRLRLKNLVQINMFRSCVSNSDRLRFFKSYLSANPGVRAHYNRWVRKIIAKTNHRLRGKDRFED